MTHQGRGRREASERGENNKSHIEKRVEKFETKKEREKKKIEGLEGELAGGEWLLLTMNPWDGKRQEGR